MARTVVAFSESIDEAGVYANIAAVSDSHVRTENDKIIVPDLTNIFAVQACLGTTGLSARLNSPTLRRVNKLYASPVTKLLVPDTANVFSWQPRNLVPITFSESLTCEALADPGAAEQHTVVVHLTDAAISPVEGEIYTVKMTTTGPVTAGVWTNSPITYVDELPSGNYSVVGARVEAAGCVAFRFFPVGESWRPGGLVNQTAGDCDFGIQRRGGLGEWFKFNTIQPPTIDLLASATAASATYNIYVDVMAA